MADPSLGHSVFNTNTLGNLRINALRAGTVSELVGLLEATEAAYNGLYTLTLALGVDPLRRLRRGYPWAYGYQLARDTGPLDRELIPPRDRLVIARVSIESPGFWEVLGQLNPLQQLREYLNDRHRRRQDREYRELAEQERLTLENQVLERQLLERDNALWRERFELLREMGYSDDELRLLIWKTAGLPLARLGHYQDVRMIEDAQ